MPEGDRTARPRRPAGQRRAEGLGESGLSGIAELIMPPAAWVWAGRDQSPEGASALPRPRPPFWHRECRQIPSLLISESERSLLLLRASRHLQLGSPPPPQGHCDSGRVGRNTLAPEGAFLDPTPSPSGLLETPGRLCKYHKHVWFFKLQQRILFFREEYETDLIKI